MTGSVAPPSKLEQRLRTLESHHALTTKCHLSLSPFLCFSHLPRLLHRRRRPDLFLGPIHSVYTHAFYDNRTTRRDDGSIFKLRPALDGCLCVKSSPFLKLVRRE